MELDIANFETEPFMLSSLNPHGVNIHIARLDKIHPLVSGNKLYKLYYFLELALQKNISIIKTYGGPYSNHLLATASACKQMCLEAVGIVRGERPTRLSETLIQCQQLGMELIFSDRNDYRENSQSFVVDEESLTIPEGGYHALGAKGASLITTNPVFQQASHIVVAVGTATTTAGLLQGTAPDQKIIAVPVLKGLNDLQGRIKHLGGDASFNNLIIEKDYHFGGYAKHSPELFQFMNFVYEETGLPTDFVYTGKMMFAMSDLVRKGKIAAGSNVLCIHSGGLQGNRSLPQGTLIF